MFLDSNNCYHIDRFGLYVYWPEIGKVLFYKEKTSDKILKFDKITLDTSKGVSQLVFTQCEPIPSDDKKSLTQKFKAWFKRTVDILFYSQNSNNLFKTFFQKERAEKTDLLTKRGQIDYLLVIKSSKARSHNSKEEPRILRIDWANKIIKYYGDEAVFRINDFSVPREFPLGISNSFFPYEIDDKMVDETDDFVMVEAESNTTKYKTKPESNTSKFKKQLISNGHAHALLTPSERASTLTGFETLVTYLKKAGFFPETYKLEEVDKILDILDSSILKNNWIDTIKTYITGKSAIITKYLDSISLLLTQAQANLRNIPPTIAPMMTQDKNITSFQYFVNDVKTMKGYQHSFRVNIPTNTNAGSFINFNFNQEELLSKRNSETASHKVANCGAENCYFTVNDNTGATFGLRISSNIYLLEDYGIYNAIIENLINAIMYFYFNNSALADYKDKLPEVSAVLKFGFIKVPFTIDDGKGGEERKEGYIPYTLTEHKPTYKTLMHEINLLCDMALEIREKDPCYVERYIKNILAQVYNFYVIARPYFKFSHNDFKTNNILINTAPESDKPPKIYIIDFGYAQINFSNGSRTYNLTNRINFYNDDQGKKEEYEFLIRNLNDIYSTDNDIETLLYWLINPYEFYDKTYKLNETNASNASKFYYHRMLKEMLEFMQPLTFIRPNASRHNKTMLGYVLYKCPELNYSISLIEYRLYQIYILLIKLKEKCDIKPALINKDTCERDNPYIKYFFDYHEDKYVVLSRFIEELKTCANTKEVSLPATKGNASRVLVAGTDGAAAAESTAGGSRIKGTHKNTKKTKKYYYRKKRIISKKRK